MHDPSDDQLIRTVTSAITEQLIPDFRHTIVHAVNTIRLDIANKNYRITAYKVNKELKLKNPPNHLLL